MKYPVIWEFLHERMICLLPQGIFNKAIDYPFFFSSYPTYSTSKFCSLVSEINNKLR